MVTKVEIDRALAAHKVWAKMGHGRYWRLRRNGATKLWKTRPNEFRIPVKAGLKACGYIDHTSQFGPGCAFVISDTDPNERS